MFAPTKRIRKQRTRNKRKMRDDSTFLERVKQHLRWAFGYARRCEYAILDGEQAVAIACPDYGEWMSEPAWRSMPLLAGLHWKSVSLRLDEDPVRFSPPRGPADKARLRSACKVALGEHDASWQYTHNDPEGEPKVLMAFGWRGVAPANIDSLGAALAELQHLAEAGRDGFAFVRHEGSPLAESGARSQIEAVVSRDVFDCCLNLEGLPELFRVQPRRLPITQLVGRYLVANTSAAVSCRHVFKQP
jgi:hypothetical protein